MTAYRVECRRVGDWWAIRVPDIKGLHSQARRLDQVPAMARDAIALMRDVDPAAIEVEVHPEAPEEVEAARAARREADHAERLAREATARAVHALLHRGLTVRDAGALLDISPQRVSQIARRHADRRRDGRSSAA